MGGLFGGGGGGSAPEQKPSAEEIELGRLGVEKFNRYQSRYAPLENKMVEGIDRPTVALHEGRTNADIMREASRGATQAIESGGVSQGLSALDNLERGTASAQTVSAGDALIEDREAQDSRALNVIETGLGISSSHQESLTEAGRQANSRALTALENETMLNGVAADNQAQILGSLAGAGMQGYGNYKQSSRLKELTYAPALNDFSEYGR